MRTRLQLLLLFLLNGFSRVEAQTDIVQYTIRLESLNYIQKTLSGHATIQFTTDGLSLDTIHLDLLKFNIDSVVGAGSSLAYLYNDTLLSIPLQALLIPGDTQQLDIYYRGAPQKDPSGWGGFYFTGVDMFNLGVGFESNPHNFGRSWFPCRDNFTDRASYKFEVVTDTGFKAFCNGILTNSVIQPNNTIRWEYEMNDPIPTYLASVAIAPYTTWQRNFHGIPVEIACRAGDSANVSITFQHLDSVLGHFIDAYGPYRFDKVGYCLVPFNSGAMEHATSIHIGSSYVNGTLLYESLWIHELAHMWWGDWVTCETEGDMWLNEGFATYNEAYMKEKLYGNEAYRNTIRSNHRKVLQFAHITDNGYRPLINIPHEYTYGPTVYNKGAEVARTLRHYVGDSLFFNGCRHYMNSLGNGHANSYDLRDALTTGSGITLHDFFEDWVFTPGFPHFRIDSVVHVPGGLDHYFIYLRQEGRGNNHIYRMNIPFTLSDGVTDTTVYLYMDSSVKMFHIPLLFLATHFTIDKNDFMADAVIDYERIITSTGAATFPETYATMNVMLTGTSSTQIRVEHHYHAPDSFQQAIQGMRLSDYHYWRIDGITDPAFVSKITFNYNGSANANAGFMDNNLITGTEDSLVLLYRRGSGYDWTPVTNFSMVTGNKFDKVGTITADTLKLGEYTLGYKSGTTSFVEEIYNKKKQLKVWPNPFQDTINIEYASADMNNLLLLIYDSSGKLIHRQEIKGNQPITWTPYNKSTGSYKVQILQGNTQLTSETIILQSVSKTK
jgi:aminopeptidase N